MKSRSITHQLVMVAAVLAAWFGGGSTGIAHAAANYYVDCSAAGAGNGTSASPWNSLASVSSRTFSAGDAILLKRGMTCTGTLWPKGSGSSGAPITLGAYGSGALPIISAGTNQFAIKLWNQQYWKIENIETTGGTRYGIFVSGDAAGTLNYFRISNVVVHDVTGGTMDVKETGLLVFTPSATNLKFNDIVIDGVNAYNTTMWGGIMVSGANYQSYPAYVSDTSLRSTNITIRNSTAHDIYGDGIVIFVAVGALLENNVAYRTGIQPTQTIGTPNAIWQWTCKDCTVQFNEAYDNHSPGVDGGAFDIDYHSENNIVQYNYGHDNQGYCMAIFGAGGTTTVNSILRYNVCANNGQAEVDLSTWDNGTIDGVQIYNNTFYTSHGVFQNTPAFTGTRARMFKNNIVYATTTNALGSVPASMSRDYNLYYYTGGSFVSGEAHSINADPVLNNPTYHAIGKPTTAFTLQSGSPAINAGTDVGGMGVRDFFGNSIPQQGAYDMGAHESSFTSTGPGPNLITNPGLEADGATTQTPSGWLEWSSAGQVDAASVGTPYAHSGTYKGVHWSANAYDVYTYQTKTGLANGLYMLRGWVASSGGQPTARMEAKDYGGAQLNATIAANTNWNQITISNINVTNGQATIGFYSVAGANQWMTFDDVEFLKQ